MEIAASDGIIVNCHWMLALLKIVIAAVAVKKCLVHVHVGRLHSLLLHCSTTLLLIVNIFFADCLSMMSTVLGSRWVLSFLKLRTKPILIVSGVMFALRSKQHADSFSISLQLIRNCTIIAQEKKNTRIPREQ